MSEFNNISYGRGTVASSPHALCSAMRFAFIYRPPILLFRLAPWHYLHGFCCVCALHLLMSSFFLLLQLSFALLCLALLCQATPLTHSHTFTSTARLFAAAVSLLVLHFFLFFPGVRTTERAFVSVHSLRLWLWVCVCVCFVYFMRLSVDAL